MDIKKDYEKIPGWLQLDQAKCLHEFAMLAPIPNYVEIGTYAGRSASVIANVAKERNGYLMCFDFFMRNHKLWGTDDVIIPDGLVYFRDAMEKQGVLDRIITIRGNTENTLPMTKGVFGMVYVDGGHIEKYLSRDLEWVYQHTIPGGYIICHDYTNKDWPDVRICVDNFLAYNHLKIVKQVGSMVVIKR